MFNWLKKKETVVQNNAEDDKKNSTTNHVVISASGITITQSVEKSKVNASKTFAKPSQYAGNRKIYDDGVAKAKVKQSAFMDNKVVVKDPYTGKKLELHISDAKIKYGDNWTSHVAEADHIVPLEKVYDKSRNNPWLSNEDIKGIANSNENLEVVSRKFNNAKRSRTNEKLVLDTEYQEKTGLDITEKGKQQAIDNGRRAQSAIDKKTKMTTVKNAMRTGHEAGLQSAQSAGSVTAVMSGVTNIVAVIQGEKSVEDALIDTAGDIGKASISGYITGGVLTTVSHSLTSSSSTFLRNLASSNVPGQIITTVVMTGNTIQKYLEGQITTQECIIELGEKGLNLYSTGYAMVVGQSLIPIPIVGAAVGALIGSALTSGIYGKLISDLRQKQFEHEERLGIIWECEILIEQEKIYRRELETYLTKYFNDYQKCFDNALCEIEKAFQERNYDGIIQGTNQITRKLNGTVHYETVDEFKAFLSCSEVDVL